MSGAAFEGLEHAAGSSQGEDYRASERGFEQPFVRSLIDKVEAMSWDEVDESFTEPGFMRSTAALYADLSELPAEALDCQAILDTAVWMAGELLSLESGKLERLPSILLDPLVQALYLLGKNSFRIDTTTLRWNPYVAAGRLAGTRDRPLELAYIVKSDAVRFGTGAKHCRLTLSGISGPYDEYEAKRQDMGKRHLTYQVGDDAVSTEFFVPFAEFIASDARECRFHVYHEDSRVSLLTGLFRREGFFERRNSLLVPDGRGRWTGVVPE